MMRDLSFYVKELLLTATEYFPVIIIGSVFVVTILLVIFVTRKMTDRRWLKEPDKLEKATKLVIHQHRNEVQRMKRERDKLFYENRDLREIIATAVNTLNHYKKEIKK